MSFISLIFGLGNAQTTIGALSLDALLIEDVELNGQVTRYAVEDGPPVTDHIVQDVEKLSLSGVVTSAGVLTFGAGGRSKLMAAKEALRLIHELRLPITITTGLDVYTDMGMVNAKIGRSGPTERLTIDCEFQKIRKVVMRQADIPPEKVAPKAKGKAGATATKGGKVGNSSASSVTPAEGMKQSQLDKLINGKKAAAPAASPGTIMT